MLYKTLSHQPQPAMVSIPWFSIKMFLNLDVDKINMNVNEIVGLPPPHEHCLFVLIIPAALPFPQSDDWRTGHEVTPHHTPAEK